MREAEFVAALVLDEDELDTELAELAASSRRGATPEQREKFVALGLLRQRSLCCFCRLPVPLRTSDGSGYPVLDHDHSDGVVRGVAHNLCNALGRDTGSDPLRDLGAVYAGFPTRFTEVSTNPRADAQIHGWVNAEVADNRMAKVGIRKGAVIPVAWHSREMARVWYRGMNDGSLRSTPVQWKRFVHLDDPHLLSSHAMRSAVEDVPFEPQIVEADGPDGLQRYLVEGADVLLLPKDSP